MRTKVGSSELKKVNDVNVEKLNHKYLKIVASKTSRTEMTVMIDFCASSNRIKQHYQK